MRESHDQYLAERREAAGNGLPDAGEPPRAAGEPPAS
jgi:hypothetical protein